MVPRNLQLTGWWAEVSTTVAVPTASGNGQMPVPSVFTGRLTNPPQMVGSAAMLAPTLSTGQSLRPPVTYAVAAMPTPSVEIAIPAAVMTASSQMLVPGVTV